ncbi:MULTISPECIES: hypothetical protein [Staphylococcus]|uniref:DUF1642 domain-containing protein n=1 Tax=Staphylococcus agnetis TaxID=985762 RepID=A0AAW9Z349_9STAP|nr:MULTISPECIES: hypothetical protein [Staphylococcus]NHM92950.1 hypothetical protein [Staphylococcus sp. 10602379]NJI03087.1 hypothetical protein [Staphylococcus agnetis]
MVKIKTKKEMTLPELIEWAWKNGIKNEEFTGSRGGRIYFYETSYEASWVGIKEPTFVEPKETFEVEIEEEITEYTKIPRLIEVYEYDGRLSAYLNTKMPIKKVLNDSQNDPLYVPIAFYMLNDDMTMTLLWKDGEMVE